MHAHAHVQAFWSIFGFFDVGEFASSPGASIFGPALLFFYLFFVATPVMNLLIAMFSGACMPYACTCHPS